jgi:thiamine-phosphate pyrophosphorylase
MTSSVLDNQSGDVQSSVARLRGLYVVTDARAAGGHRAMAQAALKGGARIVQLRDKTLTLAQLLPIANALREMAHNHGALFLVNDRIDLALACGADGVHLGPDDLPVHIARRLMPHGILGASCGDEEEARRAESEGADYIGAGAVFGTQTKADAGAPIGLETLSAIVRATRLPVAAIGGIDLSNIASVLQAGAQMACVVSAISAMRDEDQMTDAARDLVAAMNDANESSTR